MRVDDMEEELTRLRESIAVPPSDPARERALMAAFDAHWSGPEWRRVRWAWVVGAAPIAAALVLAALAIRDLGIVAPLPVPQAPPQQTVLEPRPGGFVPWPGSHALPPFEGGELREVDLPVASLPELGLAVPANAQEMVKAEVVVGHDGFRRAVRLAQ
jgi:hypothetical protein